MPLRKTVPSADILTLAPTPAPAEAPFIWPPSILPHCEDASRAHTCTCPASVPRSVSAFMAPIATLVPSGVMSIPDPKLSPLAAPGILFPLAIHFVCPGSYSQTYAAPLLLSAAVVPVAILFPSGVIARLKPRASLLARPSILVP